MSAFSTVLLCEYVLQDITNKHSAIGIFTGDVVVNSFPANLRFSLLFIMASRLEGSLQVAIEIFFDEKKVASGSAMGNARPNNPSIFSLSGIAMKIDNPCEIKIYATANDAERELVIHKKVYEGKITPTSVSVQPS